MEDIRILLVNESPDELNNMTDVLKKENYTVIPVLTEHDAMQALEDEDIKIAVIDIPVNEIDSYEILSIIRKKYFKKRIQVIFISKSAEEVSKAIEAGSDDFITKPFTAIELISRIKAAQIRYKTQINLYHERDFFKQAVSHEENLTSKVLDQHLYLKQAFRKIETVNTELKSYNKKLEKIAKYDILSGLLNRMSLFALMDVEIERSMRTGTEISGIMIDIDNFKKLNDNYGHPLGDEAIREIGTHLNRIMRKYDNAGRYGGEEFFVIMPNTIKEQAVAIAERIRQDFEKIAIHYNDDVIRITASLGVAEYSFGESRVMWISRADKAMYRAKTEGRNKVVAD